MSLSKPDLVYLWVDGGDHKWQQKRHATALTHCSDKAWRFANVEGRFRDNEELRYSLRSLMPHLHHFNKILIVTDDQKPHWVNDNERLQFVDHRQIRPHLPTPTFSSQAIEASLLRMPWKNDVVYLNDDIFLGGAYDPSCVYHAQSGKTIAYFERAEDADPLEDAAHNEAMRVSHAILASRYNLNGVPNRPLAHGPRYLIHDRLTELAREYPQAFEQAEAEIFRFRGTPSFTVDLYARWMIATDEAEVGHVPHMMISSGEPTLGYKLIALRNTYQELVFFCINDTLDNVTDHPALDDIRNTLEKIFPDKSIFEK
jgi:hypothetical protein